jgi:hypothetical protein
MCAQSLYKQLSDYPDMICSLSGPILVTAPHSITLPPLQRKEHLREFGTAHIAIALSKYLHSRGIGASTMIWNPTAESDMHRADPNHLPLQDMGKSVWNRALHQWVLQAEDSGAPLLHVDIHGKITDELFLDVGIAALENIWPKYHQGFVTALKCKFAQALEAVLIRHLVHGPRSNLVTVQTDPKLSGFRSNGFATMSMQAAMLGVPSIQIEFPAMLRERLLLDGELCNLLAQGIASAFHQTVKPWYLQHSGNWKDVFEALVPCQSALTCISSLHCSGVDQYQAEDSKEPEMDIFTMLGGMVTVAHVDGKGQSLVAIKQSGNAFPAQIACKAWLGTVPESGPHDGKDFELWCRSLIEKLDMWEQMHGKAAPKI